LLQRIAEEADDAVGLDLYRDPQQPAVDAPGAIPAPLQSFATDALKELLDDPQGLACALGEVLTELKANIWFETGEAEAPVAGRNGLTLDRRTRMMYDAHHVFINGESYRAAGRDATLMRRLADQRSLSVKDLAKASEGAMELLTAWCDDGWAHST
jgi:50S ribosomal protein L16 3-hydroxylase